MVVVGTVQPGGRIDPEVWERFKSFVEEKHGRTRGVTGNELEKALTNHMSGQNPTEPIHRIENDVATMKSKLARLEDALSETDGGDVVADPGGPHPPPNPDTHTRADIKRACRDDDRPDGGEDATDRSKPDARAPKADKAEYIFEDLNVDGIVTSPRVFDTKVSKAWGFGDRATDDIRERIFEAYHAEAVSTDGSCWHVAVGKTEADRDDGIDDWIAGQEVAEDDVVFVSEANFEGFDTNGVPNGVKKR
jgi:hypothetical protein